MFEDLKRERRKGLIAYLTAGDPAPERTPALVEALVRGGADLIELGVPFSDPIADGPVIQRAGERALAGRHDAGGRAGNRGAKSASVARRRCCCSPISTRCCATAWSGWRTTRRAAGIDGCLLTDASVEEAQDYVGAMHRHGLDTVFLAAPTSTPRRLETGGAIFHRLRLPGFAHRRDRRARFAIGAVAPLVRGNARDHGSAAGGGVRHLASRSTWRSWAGRWRRWWWAARSCG